MRPFAFCTVASSASGSSSAAAASSKTSTTVCEATSPASAPPIPSATTDGGGRSRNESSLPSRSRPTSDSAACSTTPSSSASARITSLVGEEPTPPTYPSADGPARRWRTRMDGCTLRPGRPGRPRRKTTLTIARSIALSAALFALLAGAADALPGGARYAGDTDDGGAVMVRLSPDAARVKRMRIHYTVTCNDGKNRKPTYTDILDARVKKDGTFSGSGSYEGSQGHDLNRFKVAGKVTKRKAQGTFSLTSTAGDARCKTGKLTWSAKRQK